MILDEIRDSNIECRSASARAAKSLYRSSNARNAFRVHFITAWVGYDAHERGASTVEQINSVNFTWKYHPTGIGARIEPLGESVDQLLWSVKKKRIAEIF